MILAFKTDEQPFDPASLIIRQTVRLPRQDQNALVLLKFDIGFINQQSSGSGKTNPQDKVGMNIGQYPLVLFITAENMDIL